MTGAQPHSSRSRAYSAAAGVSAAATLMFVVLVGGDTANRVAALLLAIQAFAPIAFAANNRRRLSPASYVFAWAAAFGWIGLGLGMAAELLVFTNSPGARDAAVAFASISGIALLLGLVSLGLSMLWRRQKPGWVGFALVSYPLLEVALFALALSPFLAPSVMALLIALVNLADIRME